jgi:hypothetical protein
VLKKTAPIEATVAADTGIKHVAAQHELESGIVDEDDNATVASPTSVMQPA